MWLVFILFVGEEACGVSGTLILFINAWKKNML